MSVLSPLPASCVGKIENPLIRLGYRSSSCVYKAWLPKLLRIQDLVTEAAAAYTTPGDRSSSYIFVTNPKRRIHVKSLDLGCRCRLWPNGGVCGLVCQKILQLPTSSGPLFSFYSIPVDFLKLFRSLHSLQ